MKNSAENLYTTSDLSLASAIALFYPLWAINRSNPVKAEFLFERKEGLDEVIEAFWKNELKVSPLAYFQELKILKSRLYEK
jgi:hypothetical protein